MAELESLVNVRNVDDVTLASRAGITTASSLGAGVSARARLDLVIRELGCNLVHHAGGGCIKLLGLQDKGRRGLLIESRDKGPGIDSLIDRDSTGLGFGLAAVQRNSSEFTLQSAHGAGTCIRAVVWWPSTST